MKTSLLIFLYTFRTSAVFVFEAGGDDLAVVAKEDLNACKDTNPMFYTTIGPAVVEIDQGRLRSLLHQHCHHGQKLAIKNVSAAPPAQGPARSSTWCCSWS